MTNYISTSELVDFAKQKLDITGQNDSLTDDQIRLITRLVGELTRGPVNFLTMATVTAAEFPKFFSKYELAPQN